MRGKTRNVRAEGTMHHEANLTRYHELLFSLAWRDIRVRYKQSLLGIAWALLLPLSLMFVFTFVFTRAIDARSVLGLNMPYALYAYSGLVPWTFFSLSLSGCVTSLVSNRNLVTKVYFPREVFPLSCIASSLIDFAIGMAALGVLLAYFTYSAQWRFSPGYSLAFVPVVIVIQIVWTIGLGLLLAMANLFYRDVKQIFNASIQLLMFVSGVVVPLPKDDSLLATLVSLNPLVWIIEGYRDCILHGRLPNGHGMLYAMVVSLVLLCLSWSWFRRASYRFAECI